MPGNSSHGRCQTRQPNNLLTSVARCCSWMIVISYAMLSPVLAENTVQVQGTKKFEPSGALGIFLSLQGTITETATTIDSQNAHAVTVSIPANKAPRGSEVFASSMLVSKEGKVAFTPVTRVGSRTSPLPICSEQLPPKHVLMSQSGLLQSLVEVREARIKVMQDKFRLRLGQFDKVRIAKLENGLGLAESDALETLENPYEIVERLSRLLVAIKTYEVRNKRTTK